jgi:hypothetical protein
MLHLYILSGSRQASVAEKLRPGSANRAKPLMNHEKLDYLRISRDGKSNAEAPRRGERREKQENRISRFFMLGALCAFASLRLCVFASLRLCVFASLRRVFET